MAKVLILVLILGFVASSFQYDLEAILNKVPEEEKLSFLKHHLYRGFRLHQFSTKISTNDSENTEPNMLSDDFSFNFYKSFKEDPTSLCEFYPLLFGTVICFPNGECVDVGDPGVHPKNVILKLGKKFDKTRSDLN